MGYGIRRTWFGREGGVQKVANPNDSTKAQFNNSGEKKSAILQNVGFGWFRFDSVPLVKCACRGLRQTNIYKCSNRTDNCIFICTRSTSHHPENIYIYILYIFRCTYIGAHLAGAKSISRFDSILHLVEVESSMGRRFHSFIHSMASHWQQKQQGQHIYMSNNNRSYNFIAWHGAYESRPANPFLHSARGKKNTPTTL